MDKFITGTEEWANHSFDIGTGCSHNCGYCYARAFALKNGNIKSLNDWSNEKINPGKVAKEHPKYEGVVMYPSAHDITPYYLEDSIKVINKLLKSGNKVLVATKAHLSCMKKMCRAFEEYKDSDQIEFRVTIGCTYYGTCEDWEPGAPAPFERVEALRFAFDAGYKTSVSIEPFLEDRWGTLHVVETVLPYVTEDIWIGIMNKVVDRADMTDPETVGMVLAAVSCFQSDRQIVLLYHMLKNNNKIKWNDSIKTVLRNNDIAL